MLSAANNVATQKVLVENDAEAGRRALGGGAMEDAPIQLGGIVLNESSVINATGVAGNVLSTISDGNFPSRDGHVIIILNTTVAGGFTVQHGTGNLRLRGNANAVLENGSGMLFVKRGSVWEEISRREQQPSQLQQFLQLGSAAYQDQYVDSGSPGDLNATELQGFLPTDFQLSGSTADDSNQLGGQSPSAFLQTINSARAESNSTQVIKNALVINQNGLFIDGTGSTKGVNWQNSGTTRNRIVHNPANADFLHTIYDTNGITKLAEWKFDSAGDVTVNKQDGRGFVNFGAGADYTSLELTQSIPWNMVNDAWEEITELRLVCPFDGPGWIRFYSEGLPYGRQFSPDRASLVRICFGPNGDENDPQLITDNRSSGGDKDLTTVIEQRAPSYTGTGEEENSAIDRTFQLVEGHIFSVWTFCQTGGGQLNRTVYPASVSFERLARQ